MLMLRRADLLIVTLTANSENRERKDWGKGMRDGMDGKRECKESLNVTRKLRD